MHAYIIVAIVIDSKIRHVLM